MDQHARAQEGDKSCTNFHRLTRVYQRQHHPSCFSRRTYSSDSDSSPEAPKPAHPARRNPSHIMGPFDSPKQVALSLVSRSSAPMSLGSDFLVEPIFVHGLSGSLHLVLLLALLVSWVCKKIRAGHDEGSKGSHRRKRGLFYKLTLSWALGVSLFNLALCVSNYFYWYRNGWSDVRLVSLVDSALATLAWGAVCVYLHGQNSDSGESKFPFLILLFRPSLGK